MTSIVRDQWYVAAYGREVGRELFSRTIRGERSSSGAPRPAT